MHDGTASRSTLERRVGDPDGIAADTSSRERPHRSSRTPIWNGNDEFTTQRDHELQEAFDAAYLIASFTPERKALMKILCECTYQPHQEVVELFGQRNASGALFGATGVICKCERIVRNVLYDQFMSLDSGLAVCCLLGTWQKNAGLLEFDYECIFYLTYNRELSDAHQVAPMTSLQQRIFDHVRSAPAEVLARIAMLPPPSLARIAMLPPPSLVRL